MHEAIDQPSMKKKLDDEGNEIEGMNIPMSVGAGRSEKDKKGVDSIVYDIVVNPDVIKDIEEDATGKFREFICQLGIQSIEQKYKENLDKRYKIPKLKYMGSTIPRQYIKDRKSTPQIEEVTGKNSSKAATNKKAKATTVEMVPETEKDLTASMSWVAVKASNEQSVVDQVLSWIHQGKMTDHCMLLPYDYSIVDYIDPIVTPPTNAKCLLLSVELQSYQMKLKDMKISVSPFKLELKIPGYKKMGCYLGAAILPNQARFFVRPVEGFVSMKKLEILLVLDEKEWAIDADPGSKQWLIALALSDESEVGSAKSTSNPYASRSSNSLSNKTDENRPEFAEDKFHIKLPDNVDPYTGLTLSENPMDPDSWDLPEDRFHKKDAASSYLLEQREKTKQEKVEKYEK